LGLPQIKYQQETLQLLASDGTRSPDLQASCKCLASSVGAPYWFPWHMGLLLCCYIHMWLYSIICYYFIIFYPVSCGVYIVYNYPAAGNCLPWCRAPKIKDFGKGGRTLSWQPSFAGSSVMINIYMLWEFVHGLNHVPQHSFYGFKCNHIFSGWWFQSSNIV